MGRNSATTDIILDRRQHVSRLRLRGYTQREIAVELCVSAATVNRDIAALESEWRARSAATIDEHKSRILAELTEVKRYAWQTKDVHAVLKALKAEADLLGVEAPVKTESKVEVTVSDARERLTQQFNQLASARDARELTGNTN